jgi:hypothetical protein
MGFDLSSLDTKTPSEQGIVVHLESPADGSLLYSEDGKPVTITILGDDSEKIRKFVRKAQDQRIERMQKNRPVDVSLLTLENEQARKLALATVAWSEIVFDGAALECTEANAYRVYTDPRVPWLVEQLIRAGSDRSRFFKRASAT